MLFGEESTFFGSEKKWPLRAHRKSFAIDSNFLMLRLLRRGNTMEFHIKSTIIPIARQNPHAMEANRTRTTTTTTPTQPKWFPFLLPPHREGDED